ncbi:MAG: thioredoxin-disulfide reductase [Alphaproteobacteria bacterium]|nr:thioredoxin-disulfide reductase [Alphaproteobacteria bacterium]
MHTRVLIIGSGPAGYTAGIYTARAGLETVLMTGHMAGGQLMLTHEVENYPGFTRISGIDLMASFQKQAESVGVQLKYEMVKSVDFSKRPFKIKTEMNRTWTADAVIIATGSSAKWLEAKGEEKYRGHGVSICATCDGFFYRGKSVAVIGGGSSAVYEALYLAQIADKVTLIHRRDELRAEKHLQNQLLVHPKISIRWDSEVVEFLGEQQLNALKIKNAKTGDESVLPIDGAFVAIGNRPNTEIFKGQLDLSKDGYIKTHKSTCATSVEGVFACGDVQEDTYRQAIIAAGNGCVAALSAEKFLLEKK